MTTTARFTPAQDAWTEIATTFPDVAVHLRSNFDVILHVAASAPSAAIDTGIALTPANTPLLLPALSSGDRVYARSTRGGAVVDVVAS
jgi:hypothetical protein